MKKASVKGRVFIAILLCVAFCFPLCAVATEGDGDGGEGAEAAAASEAADGATDEAAETAEAVALEPITYLYEDIEDHKYAADIAYVTNLGLIDSFIYSDGKLFAPDRALTRGDFIMALARLANVNQSYYKYTAYRDLKDGDTYMAVAEWARTRHIINHSGNLFGPDLKVNRQDMAVGLYNLTVELGYKLPAVHGDLTFADVDDIHYLNKRATKYMYTAGIMELTEDGEFLPKATLSRGEACVILHNYIDAIVSVNDNVKMKIK